MALKGTLRDFGIGDILQLIGHQRKSGVLHVREKDQAVQVHFFEGDIVRAVSAGRNRQDLLGAMLVRAELLTQAQLDEALAVQKRTLRRLGDILASQNTVEPSVLSEMHRLQTTEAVYKLFGWKNGTYEFEQQEVEYDREIVSPISSEDVLMEGFRIFDEWPAVRKRICSPELTFDRLKSPEEGGSLVGKSELGKQERAVYALASSGLTVQRIVDLACRGEFETYNSLARLVDLGYLQPVAPSRLGCRDRRAALLSLLSMARRAAAQILVGVAILAGLGWIAYLGLGAAGSGGVGVISPRALQSAVAAHAEARIEKAVLVHRLETGAFPDSLEVLIDKGLVSRQEISYPYSSEWFYRVAEDRPEGYLLLRPIP